MFVTSILELRLFVTQKHVITVMNMVKCVGFEFGIASRKHPLTPLCSEGMWRRRSQCGCQGRECQFPFAKMS